VRRMCDAVGHPVKRLVRTRIGPFTERTLAPGEWRPLTGAEVHALRLAANPVDEPDGEQHDGDGESSATASPGHR